MTPDDRDRFRENFRLARYAMHSARCYARDGNSDAVMNCLRIASHHRLIAKDYLLRPTQIFIVPRPTV